MPKAETATPGWKCPNCGWRRGAPPEDYAVQSGETAALVEARELVQHIRQRLAVPMSRPDTEVMLAFDAALAASRGEAEKLVRAFAAHLDGENLSGPAGALAPPRLYQDKVAGFLSGGGA